MKKLLSYILVCSALSAVAACDPETPDSLSLRSLNTGPAGSALSFDLVDQRATIAVGTALAFDCNEVVETYYRAQCDGLTVASNNASVALRTVYRPRVDGSVSATSAFAIVGMAPGTAQVQVRTSANEYILTVNVVP